MQIVIQETREQATSLAAAIIARQLRRKQNSVLGLATGRTMERLYAKLAEMHRDAALDFSLAVTFNLDEYVGLPASHKNSYRYYMNHHLFSRVNIDLRNTHLPDGMAPDPVEEGCRYEALIEDIGGIEKALQKAYPDWSVRRAFTAQIIINHVQARDGEKIDNMDQALQRAVDNGVKNLIVQPTHLMHGAEYDELSEAVASYSDKFESVTIAEPLLGEVGSADDSVNSDKEAVAKAVTAEAVKTAGYESLDAAKEDGTAFVFMGHGTSHTAKISYSQMQNQMNALGYDNVFIGTVEGEPEDTACEAVIEKIPEAGYKKVVLRPLMVVAGDHANNDMAGDDDDSWKSQFEASGVFDSIETQIAGLGQIPVIQDLYVSHTHAAMEELGTSAASSSDTTDAVLEDGTYEAEFKTDSGMFHVNEANDGKGVLTVKDGQMSIHISLTSKNIVNLFVGKAADAKKDGAELLQPTTDTVTYDDGTTEEVNGFDVPVKALDKDFDLALIGTKGKWYDHTVSVTNPVKVD